MSELFNYAPLYGRNPGPQFRGMFNTPGSPLMQVAGQFLSSQLAARSGMMPMQFFPEQSAYDQLLAMQMYNQQQAVANRAARMDALQLQQVFGGTMQLMSGQPLSLAQQQQSVQMSQQVSSMLPMLAPLLGTRVLDDLHGRTGSAVAMSAALGRGMRTMRDPLSRGLGASADTASVITNELFASLYGNEAGRVQMRGIKAGSAGELFEELAYRGLTGPLTSQLSLHEQAAAASRLDMDNARVSRMAENTPFIRDLRSRGISPTAQDYAKAETQVKDTFGKLGTLPPGTTASDLAAMPGAEDMLRAGDTERIAGRLKNLSGAVAAMREIFGDMGRPDAPMREIINGLDALTQGGLANMAPGHLEKTVRTTQALARQSGMDIQSFLGLTAQGAQIADRLKLDRGSAVTATQRAVAFGSAAQEHARLDLPTFGGLALEEMTLLDMQLQMNAQASPVANQLNATMRMAEAGLLGANTPAARMAEAIRRGQTEFDSDGRGTMQTLGMSSAAWKAMLAQSGVRESTVQAMEADRFGNQQYGQKYGTVDIVRPLQAAVDIKPKIAASFQAALGSGLTQGETADALKAAGFTPEQLLSVSRQASGALADQFLQMTPEQYRDPNAANEFMVGATQTAIQDSVRRQALANGMHVMEADRLAAQATQDPRLMRSLGLSTLPQLNRTIQQDPSLAAMRSYVGAAQMFGNGGKLQQEVRNRMAEATTTAAMAEAYAGLGTDGPLGRLTEALRTADATTPLTHVLAKVAGGIPLSELAEKHPQLQALLEQTRQFEHAERDGSGALSASGQAARVAAAANTAALVAGGSLAKTRRMELWAARGGKPGDIDRYAAQLADELAAATSAQDRERIAREQQLELGLRTAGQNTGVEQLLRASGYATDTKLSAGAVDRAMQYGEQLTAGTDEERLAAAKKFLTHAQSAIDTISTSPADLAQLGGAAVDANGRVIPGGKDLLEKLRGDQGALLQLAEKHKLTAAEVLAGKAGDAARTQAMSLRGNMLETLTTIRDLKMSQKMPGADRGDGRTALSPDEIKNLQAEADFQVRQFSGSPAEIEKQQAQYLAERWRDSVGVTGGREFLAEDVAEAIHSQGAGLSVFRALQANEQLQAHVARKKNLDLAKMSAAQRDTAVQGYLDEVQADPTAAGADGATATNLARQAALVRGATDTRQILDRVKDLRGMTAADKERLTAARQEKMSLTGKLQLVGLKEALLEGVGISTAGGVDFAGVS